MFITQGEVQQWFSESFLTALFGNSKYRVEDVARTFLASGGHRWRPWLCAGVSQSLSASSSKESIHIAVAIECFHKASLIHDDIEDDDKPNALHRTIGIPQALNAGDFLIHQGYRLLAKTNHRFTDLLMAESIEAQLSLCRGQGEELATGKNEYAFLKTCPLFNLAFSLGSLCAEHFHCGLGFANQLGIAYQLKDDLQDGCGNAPDTRNAIDLTKKSIDQFTNPHLKEFLHHYLDTMFKSEHPSHHAHVGSPTGSRTAHRRIGSP